MQAGAAVADLRAGDQRRTFAEAGGRRRTARALRDVLIDLAVLVGTGAEALDRGDDHARVELVDVVPGQAHAVERAGREVLDQHVAGLDQPVEDIHALGMLGVDGDRPLAAVEHGEIEAVGARHVAQLPARDVAGARTLDLDHVGAHVGEQLGASRARLHVREVENAQAVERAAGLPVGLAARLRQVIRFAVAVCLLGGKLHHLAGGFFCRGFRLGGFLRFVLGHLTSSTISNYVPEAQSRGGRFELQLLRAIYFFLSALCGLRLPMRPLSLPAAGSSTALMRVGLPESIASFTARLSSSGDVALTPTPPKASIILS